MDYVVISPKEPIDASGSTMLHLSVWRTDPTAELKVRVVNCNSEMDPAETKADYIFGGAYYNTVPAGQWVKLEIPLAELGDLNDTSSIDEFVLASNVWVDGEPFASDETLYVDDIYFSSKAAPGRDPGPANPGGRPAGRARDLQ